LFALAYLARSRRKPFFPSSTDGPSGLIPRPSFYFNSIPRSTRSTPVSEPVGGWPGRIAVSGTSHFVFPLPSLDRQEAQLPLGLDLPKQVDDESFRRLDRELLIRQTFAFSFLLRFPNDLGTAPPFRLVHSSTDRKLTGPLLPLQQYTFPLQLYPSPFSPYTTTTPSLFKRSARHSLYRFRHPGTEAEAVSLSFWDLHLYLISSI
jgi:hypothetical protein